VRPKGPEHGKAISAGIEQARARHEEYRSAEWVGHCSVCGREFPDWPYNHAMREYCKPACRQKAYRERKRAEKKAERKS
jgi:hypothetical protein